MPVPDPVRGAAAGDRIVLAGRRAQPDRPAVGLPVPHPVLEGAEAAGRTPRAAARSPPARARRRGHPVACHFAEVREVDLTSTGRTPATPRPPCSLGIVLAIHVAVGLLLICLVLLHSGKGGGLSDMFGGSVGATAPGSTAAERNLDRITVVVALVFVFTTTGLAFLLD